MNRADEIKAYKRFRSEGMSKAGACGLLGNLEAESDGFYPTRLEYLCHKRLKENNIKDVSGNWYTDATYTSAVDSGRITKAKFLNPLPGKQYGYGLAQWTTPTRKTGLYDLAKSRNVSIGDLDMQIDYLINELKNKYLSVFNVLKTAKTVKEASDIVLIKFEAPADTGTAMKESRAKRGQVFLDNYAEEENIMGSLNGLLARLDAEVGYQEKASNSNLDSKTANAGYSNYQKYSRDVNNAGLMGCQAQAWCDTFQFAVEMYEFGLDKALEHFCMTRTTYVGYSVFATRDKFKVKGRYDSIPRVGDLVIFTQSHIGRVVAVTATHITTIEGNTSAQYGERNGGMVCRKTYSRSDKLIAGYCHIDYSTSSSATPTVSTPARNYLQLGDSGSAVKSLQTDLISLGYSCGTAGADSDFGKATDTAVKSFQSKNGLVADGQAGTKTLAKISELKSAKDTTTKVAWIKELQKAIGAKVDGEAGSETLSKCPTLQDGSSGNVVKLLQTYLGNTCKIGVSGGYDGRFGAGTKSATMEFQRQKGLPIDGVVGKNTWKKILGI